MAKYRRLLSVLLAGTMILSGGLAGCGKQQAAEDNGAQPSEDAAWDTSKDDEIVLTVINNYYTAGQKKAAEEYMKLHPETKVVVDVVSDNDAYMTKMTTAFSEDKNNAPDIVHGNFLVNALTGGSWSVAFDKDYVMDLTSMLDEENPYNDGQKVRDAFEDEDITTMLNLTGGSSIGALPFDKIGVAVFYNKDLFEKEGLEVPETFEEFEKVCEDFRSKGYDSPVSAGTETSWFLNSIADAGYRSIEEQFLVQPGDAIWDENTMKANENFKFDENNLSCDKDVVNSDERILAYKQQNGVNTELNNTAWSTFERIAQYFPQNWVQADTNQVITDFESQKSPMLIQGSYNAGKIVADINMLPDDQKFEWSTFQFPSFETAPEGFSNQLRGLYVPGNTISIVPKDDQDHMERVKDFYKYMYSPDGAKMIFEETLSSGNLIQGPCVIKGVTLDKDLQEKLDGFVVEAAAKDWDLLDGFKRVTTGSMPQFYDLVNRFTEGEITTSEMLDELQPLYEEYNNEAIQAGGYDLDPATKDTAAQ